MASILLLGDSHTHGTYGQALERRLKAAGWDVTRVGWVGARADSYLTGKEKTKLGGTGSWAAAKSRRYDVAVVTLGTNDAAALPGGGSAAKAAQTIKRLANEVQAGETWYVGPPSFEPGIARSYSKVFATDDLNARSARLWTAAAPLFTHTVDPRAATQPFVSSKDIHFGPQGGAAWAKLVFAAVNHKPAAAPREVAASSSSSLPVPAIVAAGIGLLAAWWWLARRKS